MNRLFGSACVARRITINKLYFVPKRVVQDVLKRLKDDESIMVLPADKGRASVVMDTDTYHTKMSTLIENRPYQLLNKDPTNRLTWKLSETLLTLQRNRYLSKTAYNKIRPRHKQPPRIYGLPKIHKADVPLNLLCHAWVRKGRMRDSRPRRLLTLLQINSTCLFHERFSSCVTPK